MSGAVFKRWSILGGLLVLTLWLSWNAPPRDQADAVVKPLAAHRLPAMPVKEAALQTSSGFVLLPRSQPSDEIVDLFAPVTVKKEESVSAVADVPKPEAPPIPFTFIGRVTEAGRTKVFLEEGEELHLVGEGDMLGSSYRVISLENNRVSLKYLPLNIIQTVSMGTMH